VSTSFHNLWQTYTAEKFAARGYVVLSKFYVGLCNCATGF